jgi:hypothetical protein
MRIAAMKDGDRKFFDRNSRDYFNKKFEPEILTTKLVTMLSNLFDENDKLKI